MPHAPDGPFLSDEQRERGEEYRRIARTALHPLAAAGEPGRVNRKLLLALGDLGLAPRLFPRSAGGSAEVVSATELCLLRESLGRECPEAETALALQGLGGHPIAHAGSAELVARHVPRIARGEAVAAFALTEPGAGSDPGALETTATRDGDGFRITGRKTFISNAPEADVITLFARTTDGAGAKGVTAFVVEGGAKGLTGEPLDMLSPHAIGTLELDGVRVEPSAVLGEADRGFAVAMRTLDLFRPSVGAFAVGMSQAAVDAALAHARTRRQFGKRLLEFQAVSHALAEMATRTEAARLLVYRAAAAHDAGRPSTKLAAMAKLFATESAQWVVDAAVQVHGASGLVKGHLLEHLYREVRALRIYEGTSEIQRTIIARELDRGC